MLRGLVAVGAQALAGLAGVALMSSPLDIVADWAQPAEAEALKPYFYDPVGFARECIRWPDGASLAEHQSEGLAAIIKDLRVCIRSMHGAGKTTFCAIFILWFCLTRDAMCRSGDYGLTDWKLVSTAGAWRQLERYLWPEVHKWAGRLDWEKIGRKPFKALELQRLTLRLSHGEAFAVASDNVAMIEGAHADAIAYLFDESKAIPAATFDGAEGAFTQEGDESESEAFALSVSTPGEPNGRFYEIQSGKEGLDDWNPLHWTLEKVMASGRVTKTWVERRKKMYGEKSALFANRVLGEFHSADEDGVIPLSWIEAAVERWKDNRDLELYDEPTEDYPLGKYTGEAERMGVDVARQGEDKTVFAIRHDEPGRRIIAELRDFFHADTMETAGNVKGVIRRFGVQPTVDTDGLGAGVTDRLREDGVDVIAFHSGSKSTEVDRSGELGFVNVKAAAWWGLRESLDPAWDPDIELPPDDMLLGDLTAPKWKVESNGRIRIEKKEEVKKRLGRSPDKADAVVMAFYDTPVEDEAFMGSMGAEDDEDDEGWSDVA
jgi:hypothetical protein